jgi:hypothetical protein
LGVGEVESELGVEMALAGTTSHAIRRIIIAGAKRQTRRRVFVDTVSLVWG